MSRALLKLGGGSGEILATRSLLSLRCRDVDARHVSASLHAPETLDGFEDTGRHPPQHHLSATPRESLEKAFAYAAGGIGVVVVAFGDGVAIAR